MQVIKRLCYNKNMGKKFRGGFTLIELSLSLIFIALLSLAVVFLIQNLTASYRRGLILDQVNTVGMDLIDDFRISVQNANSESITKMCERMYPFVSDPEDPKKLNSNSDRSKCIKDNASSFVSVTKYGTVKIDNKTLTGGKIPIYGAFCTGSYTYIWNTGYFESSTAFGTAIDQRLVDPGTPAEVGYKDSSGNYVTIRDNFRLLKIYDNSRSICINSMIEQNGGNSGYVEYHTTDSTKNYENNYNNNLVKPKFIINSKVYKSDESNSEGRVSELLKKDSKYSDLVLYDMYVAKPALSQTRKNMYYAASFILGTIRGGINIRATGSDCRPTNDNYSEIDYCAINKFNFGVMAGGN